MHSHVIGAPCTYGLTWLILHVELTRRTPHCSNCLISANNFSNSLEFGVLLLLIWILILRAVTLHLACFYLSNRKFTQIKCRSFALELTKMFIFVIKLRERAVGSEWTLIFN